MIFKSSTNNRDGLRTNALGESLQDLIVQQLALIDIPHTMQPIFKKILNYRFLETTESIQILTNKTKRLYQILVHT